MTNQRKATPMNSDLRIIAVLFILAALGMGYLLGDSFSEGNRSTIGDHTVPYNLHCEEDEVIGFEEGDLTCTPHDDIP